MLKLSVPSPISFLSESEDDLDTMLEDHENNQVTGGSQTSDAPHKFDSVSSITNTATSSQESNLVFEV